MTSGSHPDAPTPHPFEVMSFNIRRRMPHARPSHPDSWRRRAPLLRHLLVDRRPTVLGAQEVMPDQARVVLDALGPDFRRLGRGRKADGQGEGCPLFYDSRRLELVDWRQFALSDDPERAGSRTFGNWIPRIAVDATFRDRHAGTAVRIVNTHLDPFAARSRVRSARMLRDIVVASDVPVIMTGDFNAPLGSPAHRVLVDGVTLRDVVVEHGGDATAVGTFANYRPPRRGGARIDWILASPRVRVLAVETLADPIDGAWPSDHLPVCATVDVGAP